MNIYNHHIENSMNAWHSFIIYNISIKYCHSNLTKHITSMEKNCTNDEEKDNSLEAFCDFILMTAKLNRYTSNLCRTVNELT